MAALWRSRGPLIRLFGGKTRKNPNNALDFGEKPPAAWISTTIVDYSRYAKSPFVEKIREQYEYDIIKKPTEWKYVERLLPFDTIPTPPVKESYSSGWIPPKDESKDLPYFIPRTKNHFLRIHLRLRYRGAMKTSIIRKIEGDIWLLNDDLKEYLKNKHGRYIESRVHELARFIEVKGDYVIDLRNWAHSKGF